MPDGPDELAGTGAPACGAYAELGRVGDFRRGSLNEVRRKCGKPNCACAAPDHPGRGPQWNLTRTIGERTRAVHLRPGPELEKARREVAEYEQFKDLAGQVTEVNEAICAVRPAAPGGAGDDAPVFPNAQDGSSIRCARRAVRTALRSGMSVLISRRPVSAVLGPGEIAHRRTKEL